MLTIKEIVHGLREGIKEGANYDDVYRLVRIMPEVLGCERLPEFLIIYTSEGVIHYTYGTIRYYLNPTNE